MRVTTKWRDDCIRLLLSEYQFLYIPSCLRYTVSIKVACYYGTFVFHLHIISPDATTRGDDSQDSSHSKKFNELFFMSNNLLTTRLVSRQTSYFIPHSRVMGRT